MAADEPVRDHVARTNADNGDDTDSYDPRLDFFSEKFDPLLALTRENLKVPEPNAKVYDNLQAYKSNLERGERTEPRGPTKRERLEEAKRVKQERESRWLPHQLPVPTKRATVPTNNVLTRMRNLKGPTALLMRCVDEGLKIKVVTRNQKGIRGYCTAYLLAFDKFWNLVLRDVKEFWTRPKKRKSTIPGAGDDVRSVPLRPPPIKVSPHGTEKSLENCERKIDQLLMRGEHVVLITLL